MRALLFLTLAATLLVGGCQRDDRPERARTQVRRWVEKLDAQTTETGIYVRHQGPTEVDPWGNDLIVTYTHGGVAENVEVRSAGGDGIAYSDDDVVEARIAANLKGIGTGIKENIEETTEKGARGLGRGVIQGLKDGLKKDKDAKPEKENK
jgi:hypothetical protein